MNKLFTTTNKLSIVLPTHNHLGAELYPQIESIKQFIVDTTGGCSSFLQDGSWIDDGTGHLYTEPSLVIYTFCTESELDTIADEIPGWATDLDQIQLLASVEPAHVAFVEGTRALAVA